RQLARLISDSVHSIKNTLSQDLANRDRVIEHVRDGADRNTGLTRYIVNIRHRPSPQLSPKSFPDSISERIQSLADHLPGSLGNLSIILSSSLISSLIFDSKPHPPWNKPARQQAAFAPFLEKLRRLHSSG
ncbi:MAG TPA: hypothetical protein VK638_02405, partial [Edaphobacter sp.]|nr:hypothetical protein [Edaphobacter sp.]